MRNKRPALSVQEEQIICPISLEVMTDPVMAEDGNTYERSAIIAWFATHNTSPLTRAVIGNALISNNSIRSIIAEYAQVAGNLAAAALVVDAAPQNDEKEQTKKEQTSYAHILIALEKSLCAPKKDIYYGSIVEQTLVGRAAIYTSQDKAIFEQSDKENGAFDISFKLKFGSAAEHQKFVLFYKNTFKGSIVSAGAFNYDLTEVIFDTEKFVDSIIPDLGNFKKNRHIDLMKDLQKSLNVDWNAVYLGDAVERRVTNKAGIFNSQANAYFRANPDYSTVMHLNFCSTAQHKAFVFYYTENAPALIIKDYGYKAGSLSKFDLNTHALRKLAETLPGDIQQPGGCTLL
ncbi:MAG: U-box domain-containing protein [Alphaproteobacteria bacterium]|jgi:hypothetical protein|nr:U-box domain-containing protein [Candidatus Jidaibacter sp.]